MKTISIMNRWAGKGPDGSKKRFPRTAMNRFALSSLARPAASPHAQHHHHTC